MNREYHKHWSKHLQRDMELLVFGHAGSKVLVFPTRDGRFYEYENIGMVDVLRPKIEQGELQLYCIDSIYGESFYCWWAHPSGRIQRHIAFEQYLLDEVIPFMVQQNPQGDLISHGLSLGAFHAANLAFRHPQLVKRLVAFSGRYDLTLQVENFHDLLDGFYNDDIYQHTPSHFLPDINAKQTLQALREMEITLVIGVEDPFLQNNRDLSQTLEQKNIPHQLIIWNERAHSGYYWRRMAPLYL